jgi:PKD repeat protein
VRFDGSRSTDADGRIVDYSWDLDGNGTFETDTGTNPRASHTYRTPKKMTVRLRVRDDDGVSSDATATLVSHVGLSLSLKRRQRLGGRVRLKATCSAACTATFALQLSKRDARRLHLSRKIGSKKRKLRAKKKTSISLSLSKKALRRVASLSSLKPTLVVTVRDASRVPFSVSRKLTLRR